MQLPPNAPVVVIPCDRRMVGNHAFHMVGEKYIKAVAGPMAQGGSEALPLLLPVTDPAIPVETVLARADGILFTGSVSDIGPHLYGGPAPRPELIMDPHRDGVTLDLIRAAIVQGVPLFAVCRGFQELNVALGGTLHQHLQEVPGRFDHRDKGETLDVQYGPAHSVAVMPGGILYALTGAAAIEVNSLHQQGIDRLAKGLVVEAVAQDGTIEAVRVEGASAFAFAVQWHPEWHYFENPVSQALFRAFGEAVRLRNRNTHP